MLPDYRTYLWRNFTKTTLVNAITVGATSFTVADASGFPTPASGEVFPLVLNDPKADKYEVMYCVARSGNTITVERAKEDSSAWDWPAGQEVVHAITAGFYVLLSSPPQGIYFTSKPYPLEQTETLQSSVGFGTFNYLNDSVIEHLDINVQITAGLLRTPLLTYTNWPAESVDTSVALLAGSYPLTVTYTTYDRYPIEAVDTSIAMLSGVIDDALAVYDGYLPEAVNTEVTLRSGALT